ncbi:mitochondrial ribonuclease P protein 1 homolog isoform X2 [Orussus abietinus]|uniref:mitochondrial ribonuclease P protein 1 homolog isoform X2 n=1 Tax=Orussus abietinus TaxID=222816 RepID=UPI000626EA7A|nr:mitochondrial ribonuclease P protein 1 homolog isoform X2 [Orussus abietinus]
MQEGERIPTDLNARQWWELLSTKSFRKRMKYLEHLFKLEKMRENRLKKKTEKRQEFLKQITELKEERENNKDKLFYGLHGNTFFMRIYEAAMNVSYNYHLATAMQFGQKLIFDCSFDHTMNDMEINSCARQVALIYSSNRMHKEPFNIYLTNVDLSGRLMKKLHILIPNLFNDDFMLNITTKSYLELFEKKELVYLTPHCQTDMQTYDPSKIYIIGTMVDKVNPQPLTLAKAKKEGLRMEKFPLNQYLPWGPGSNKNLSLNQVVSILLDLNATRDWNQALQHVPRRKLVESREKAQERKLSKMMQEIHQLSETEEAKEAIFTFKNRQKLKNK